MNRSAEARARASIILRTTARILTPVIILLSLYLFIRGHDQPGGGFIAALVGGAAVVLRYLAFGAADVRRFLPVYARSLLGAGLSLAVLVGAAGYWFGEAFLESAIVVTTLPGAGEIKVASSLLFDFGVYLVVLAAVVSLVHSLSEEKGGGE